MIFITIMNTDLFSVLAVIEIITEVIFLFVIKSFICSSSLAVPFRTRNNRDHPFSSASAVALMRAQANMMPRIFLPYTQAFSSRTFPFRQIARRAHSRQLPGLNTVTKFFFNRIFHNFQIFFSMIYLFFLKKKNLVMHLYHIHMTVQRIPRHTPV